MFNKIIFKGLSPLASPGFTGRGVIKLRRSK